MIGTSLLEPGHWHSTFFPKGFWQQNAFPEYGADPEPEPAVALTGFNRVSISILLFDEPDGTLLADLTERVEIPTDPSTFEHGFEGVGVFVPMTEVESSYFYETALNSWLLICAGPEVIFEGRAQDVKKTTAGLDIVALGSWVATSHSTHTSFWSSTDVSLWRVVTSNDRTNRFDKKYDFDTEGRLFVSLQKDAVYEHSEMGTLAYLAPHNGSQLVKTITCNYAFNLPTGLTARIVSFDDAFANGLQEWGIVGNGTYQSGSINLTLPNEKQIITMEIRPTAQYTYTGEAGDTYFQRTSVRLMGAAAAPVTADLVIKHLVAEMSALNPGELSSDTSLIEATSSDMWNKEYQDLLIGEILSPL
ncbi:MAG: hypothetical protein GY943_31630, partial [Chloroflexi bacterium]|nr:hypothetical protein [Chloroflexota bacterium]